MHSRRLRMEPLEDRRMLATFMVSNLLDGPVTAAGQLPGSLRQAIFDANALAGPDEIIFGSTIGTINLSAGQLSITEGLNITGPGRDTLTIDAQEISRIIAFTTTSTQYRDLVIKDLTLKNGRPTSGPGGAIRFLSQFGDLIIIDCTISDNSTIGSSSDGGAIYSQYDLTLLGSNITRNSTAGSNSAGGGVYVEGDADIENSVISGNSSRGTGGGVRVAGSAYISDCAIVDNSTSGPSARGGGIAVAHGMTITNSTVSGNSTTGNDADGGGIFAQDEVILNHSTISDNETAGSDARGGGIAILRTASSRHFRISHSIILGNHAATDLADDISTFGAGTVIMNGSYSLLSSMGLTAAQYHSLSSSAGNIGNLFDTNPLLGPLQNNGGSSPTHALLPGSPAINAGDLTLVAGVNVTEFDQRGVGFPRVSNGRIDIGAFEVRNVGDFDNDGDVDGRDFLAWQRNPSVGLLSNWQNDYRPPVIAPDFDQDSDVDGRDFLVWQRGYGEQYDHDDLLAWQGQYGVGGLSAIGSQLLESLESSAERQEPEFGPGFLALSSSLARETASDVVEIIDDAATIEVAVDEAFAKIGAPSRSTIREFGDLVVRRLPGQRATASEEPDDWLSTLDS